MISKNSIYNNKCGIEGIEKYYLLVLLFNAILNTKFKFLTTYIQLAYLL